MQQMQVIFSGYVQGVGFRYTTQHLARRYDVTGFVRNLSDGRVELLSEGEEEELKHLLTDIRESSLKEGIQDVEISWKPASGKYSCFEIQF